MKTLDENSIIFHISTQHTKTEHLLVRGFRWLLILVRSEMFLKASGSFILSGRTVALICVPQPAHCSSSTVSTTVWWENRVCSVYTIYLMHSLNDPMAVHWKYVHMFSHQDLLKECMFRLWRELFTAIFYIYFPKDEWSTRLPEATQNHLILILSKLYKKSKSILKMVTSIGKVYLCWTKKKVKKTVLLLILGHLFRHVL